MAGRQRRAALLGLALVAAGGCGPGNDQAAPGSAAQLQETLAGLETVARAFPAVDQEALSWPRDHAPHAEQFTESWLVAGLLADESGAPHGFQLLLQRVALAAEPTDRASAWAARSAWHGRFVLESAGIAQAVSERVSRDALDLAGATREPPAAWLEDWRIELDPEAGFLYVRATSEDGAVALQLALPDEAPAGLAADARRGYWWPGLAATGVLRRGETEHAVQGSALLERWWGQAPPAGSGQLGLVRLWAVDETGAAVRCEELRRRGGGGTPLGECTEYPSGRQLGNIIAPDRGNGSRAGLPGTWVLSPQGGGVASAWTPLALSGAAAAEWSGVLVPAESGKRLDGWGLLVLSNFAAP